MWAVRLRSAPVVIRSTRAFGLYISQACHTLSPVLHLLSVCEKHKLIACRPGPSLLVGATAMVSSIARSALLGASLLLVGLALCADAAPHRPTVRDITRGWKPSAAKAGVASVSTAQQEGYEGYNGGDSSYGSHGSSAGYYAAVEEKEVCLVESMRRNCEYLDEFDGAYIHGEYS